MKNKWLKVMVFAFAIMFVVGMGAFNASPVMADEEMSEEAASLQDNLVGMIQQFNTKAEVDSYLDEMITQYETYYGEGAGESIKEMYNFLYDWVKIKKEIGEYKSMKDFSYDEDETTSEISSATMQIKCKDGEATLTYALTDEGVEVTIEKKAGFGELMKKAALNTLMGMGTVFAVLIFICLIISCFKFFHKEEKKEAVAVAPVVAAEPVVEEEDVTDDLELIAVISAAIAAAEGTGAEGFQVRSIKRVRRSNW